LDSLDISPLLHSLKSEKLGADELELPILPCTGSALPTERNARTDIDNNKNRLGLQAWVLHFIEMSTSSWYYLGRTSEFESTVAKECFLDTFHVFKPDGS
jgi:hypothetical protein